MNCPECSSDLTRVLDSRPRSGGSHTRRRYVCDHCTERFSTREFHIEDEDAKYDLVVVRAKELQQLIELVETMSGRIFNINVGGER